MTLIAAAMCPHPMSLIPEVAGESAEWERLRAACADSVRQLKVPVWDLKQKPPAGVRRLIVIVGGYDATKDFHPRSYASLLANGFCWTCGWGQDDEAAQPLPLSLSIGYWLISESRPEERGMIWADIAFQAVDFYATPQECAELGQDLAGRAEHVIMLVMGEGSSSMPATEQVKRAKLDGNVVRALEHADADALLDSTEFPGLGRSAWRILAAAAAAAAA
ncbi:MAG: hypothetical protein QOD02_5183, partial [Mycobacterium sp.]|nr:hypothetical protein [Mycobacterium sp.]